MYFLIPILGIVHSEFTHLKVLFTDVYSKNFNKSATMMVFAHFRGFSTNLNLNEIICKCFSLSTKLNEKSRTKYLDPMAWAKYLASVEKP